MKIGMRILKTSAAVFICFLIYMLRGRGTAFYSVIAAILCIQPDMTDSIKNAKSRTIGTFVGGFSGMLFLLVERIGLPVIPELFRYFLLSISIMPLIAFTVKIKQPSSTYLTCVVFFSITVSHSNDQSVTLFAAERVLDTLIGIFVALGVNKIHLPFQYRRLHKGIYIYPIDQHITSDSIDTYERLQLNKMLDHDVQLLFASSKTPAVLLPILKDLHLTLPIIVMDGAALYDRVENHYHNIYNFRKEKLQVILRLSEEADCNCFVYEINGESIIVHYRSFKNNVEKEIYEKTKMLPLKHYFYHRGDYELETDPVQVMIIAEKDKISLLQDRIQEETKGLRCISNEEESLQGMFFLKIYAKESLIENQAEYIRSTRRPDLKKIDYIM